MDIVEIFSPRGGALCGSVALRASPPVLLLLSFGRDPPSVPFGFVLPVPSLPEPCFRLVCVCSLPWMVLGAPLWGFWLCVCGSSEPESDTHPLMTGVAATCHAQSSPVLRPFTDPCCMF